MRIHICRSQTSRFFAVLAFFSLLCIVTISEAAELKLPSGLKRIEKQAFYGDASLDTVTIQEGTEVIESKAFARSSVKTVTLPGTLYSIADDAFDSCENLTVNAQEGTYAYTWAVKNKYIDIDDGAAGETTKVIVSDTLRAGTDLTVQIIGPADTIHHSVYIVDEQTGIYQSSQISQSRKNVIFKGYNFESGNTYRLTVYTVTNQYQVLTPVTKTIHVIGEKPKAEVLNLPDSMKINTSKRVENWTNNAIHLKAECYSIDDKLFEISEYDSSPEESIYISSWNYYLDDNGQNHGEGGVIRTRYVMNIGGLWSEWSDTYMITVVGYAKALISNISIPDVIENGKDFSIGFSFDSHIDHIVVSIKDSDNNYPFTGTYIINQDSGDYSVQVSSKDLDEGEYYLELYASSVDNWVGRSLAYQQEISVVGQRNGKVSLTSDKEELRYEESIEFTIFAPGCETAYIVGQDTDGSFFWSNYVDLDENGYGNIVYINDYGSGITALFRTVALNGDRWTQWSTPLSISMTKRPVLDAPVINIIGEITAGKDFAFSFDEVENAKDYWVFFRSKSDNESIISGWPASPTDLTEVPGYLIKSGNYEIEVEVDADGYEPNWKYLDLTVTGRRPSAPEVAVEEPLRAGQKVEFTVNTQNAEALHVMYTENDSSRPIRSNIPNESVPVTGDQTKWYYSVPSYMNGRDFTVSFSRKVDGIWSAWKTNTYMIEEPVPLSPAVIHMDDTIEERKQFGVTVEPVENATNYTCYVYNSNGRLIWANNYSDSTIGNVVLNSEFFGPGEFTFKVRAYAVGFADSEIEKTFTIAELPQLDAPIIQAQGTYTAGHNIQLSFSPVDGATYYNKQLYKQENGGITWMNNESGPSTDPVILSGYNITPGQYQFVVEACADDFKSNTSVHQFTVSGYEYTADRISVSVNKTEVFTNENSPIITVVAVGAEAVRCDNGEVYSVDENGVAHFSPYMYIGNRYEREYEFSFCAVFNDVWSEWTEPITIRLKKAPELEPLEPAVIHLPENIIAGQDFVFSFDTVDGATSYEAHITRYYSGGTMYSNYSASPSAEMMVSGVYLTPGTYIAKVKAYGAGRTSSTSELIFKVTGERADAPIVTTDKENYLAGETITFSIDTEEAEEIYFSYSYTGRYSSSGGMSIARDGNSTEWTYTIDQYNSEETYTFNFNVKKNGLWTKVKTITIVVPASD